MLFFRSVLLLVLTISLNIFSLRAQSINVDSLAQIKIEREKVVLNLQGSSYKIIGYDRKNIFLQTDTGFYKKKYKDEKIAEFLCQNNIEAIPNFSYSLYMYQSETQNAQKQILIGSSLLIVGSVIQTTYKQGGAFLVIGGMFNLVGIITYMARDRHIKNIAIFSAPSLIK